MNDLMCSFSQGADELIKACMASIGLICSAGVLFFFQGKMGLTRDPKTLDSSRIYRWAGFWLGDTAGVFRTGSDKEGVGWKRYTELAKRADREKERRVTHLYIGLAG